ncbi:hypothetical protein Q7P37_002921 [Cladosporium fusiforme]
MPPIRSPHDAYNIAWICPSEDGQLAAAAMLDERHSYLSQSDEDSNTYILGSIQGHNIVIAGLSTVSQEGPAATVIGDVKKTFSCLKFLLLVGVGGGVPNQGTIRLGHVVVSRPNEEDSGVFQFDSWQAAWHHQLGKVEFGDVRFFRRPPLVLTRAAERMNLARKLAATDPIVDNISRVTSRPQLRRFKYPGARYDQQFEANVSHGADEESRAECRQLCWFEGLRDDLWPELSEQDVKDEEPQCIVVHRGTIACGTTDTAERDQRTSGKLRDNLAEERQILCFEEDAAWASKDDPILMIRGIAHYSDSHVFDEWSGYAAAAAAAYARELFFHVTVDEVRECEESVQSYCRE